MSEDFPFPWQGVPTDADIDPILFPSIEDWQSTSVGMPIQQQRNTDEDLLPGVSTGTSDGFELRRSSAPSFLLGSGSVPFAGAEHGMTYPPFSLPPTSAPTQYGTGSAHFTVMQTLSPGSGNLLAIPAVSSAPALQGSHLLSPYGQSFESVRGPRVGSLRNLGTPVTGQLYPTPPRSVEASPSQSSTAWTDPYSQPDPHSGSAQEVVPWMLRSQPVAVPQAQRVLSQSSEGVEVGSSHGPRRQLQITAQARPLPSQNVKSASMPPASPSFVCESEGCGKSFTSASALARHERYHSRPRNHVCSTCQSRFLFHKDLKRHLQTHQVGPRSYHCPVVGCKYHQVGFHRNDHLQRHMRTHEQVRGAPPGVPSGASSHRPEQQQ